jgi:hypothetical protein
MENPIATQYFNKLQANENVLGIILFGSWARGNNRADSDIDLLVIVKDGFKRTVETYEGFDFEMTFTTQAGAIKFWSENPNDCVDLWESGQVIFDRDGTIQRLQAFAIKLKTKGKAALDSNSRKHIIFDINDQLKGIDLLLENDPNTALLLLHKQVASLCNYYFDFNQLWTPAPKQILQTIQKSNPQLAGRIRDFYTLDGDLVVKWRLAREIADIIVK